MSGRLPPTHDVQDVKEPSEASSTASLHECVDPHKEGFKAAKLRYQQEKLARQQLGKSHHLVSSLKTLQVY